MDGGPLPDREVVVCLGSGGVGKTTLAAAWGVAGAQAGQRVAVLTIDPAQRLATTLGLGPPGDHRGLGQNQGVGNEPVLVEGPWPGELWAVMLDPAATLATVIAEEAAGDQAARLGANPLLANIMGSMSGASEYLAAERLHQLHRDSRFDQVIVDTPPSRHALDFLDGPERLVRFIDNRFYQAVLAPHRGLFRPLTSAARAVFRLTSRLVGSDLVANVVSLFEDLGRLDQGFRQRAVETRALLGSERCGYALITSAREEPMREAVWIDENLRQRGHQVEVLAINRLTPFRASGLSSGPGPLWANWTELTALAAREDELIDSLVAQLGPEVGVVRVAEQSTTVDHIADLVSLAQASRPPAP